MLPSLTYFWIFRVGTIQDFLLATRTELPRIAFFIMGFPGFRSGQSKRNFNESRSTPTSSFASLTPDELESHMERSRYGSFELTDAIRPAYDMKIVPRQGFKHDEYNDPDSNQRVPVILASASRERLFDLFVDLVGSLGDVVNVVLETSHHGDTGEHQDFIREHIDMPVLSSLLYEFEDILMNDGCTGIAVVNPKRKQEIQFDEHKLLICYGSPQEIYETKGAEAAWKCMMDVVEYHVPKLARIETTGKDGGPQEWVIRWGEPK